MLGRLLRVLFGFAMGCLAAGLAMVLFVFTPSELAGLPPDVATNRFPELMRLAAYVAAQAALFAAPFGLFVALIGEWKGNRNWVFYALAGLLMALLGFLAQHSTEQVGQPTIVNNYALTAFITSGFIGGLVYWLFSGRWAGGRLAAAAGQGAETQQPATSKSPAGMGDEPSKSEVTNGDGVAENKAETVKSEKA